MFFLCNTSGAEDTAKPGVRFRPRYMDYSKYVHGQGHKADAGSLRWCMTLQDVGHFGLRFPGSPKLKGDTAAHLISAGFVGFCCVAEGAKGIARDTDP